MKKILQYFADRSAFARHDLRLPTDGKDRWTLTWREYLVLSLADGQVRSLKQTHEEMCARYGALVCRRYLHDLVSALIALEERGLLEWQYDGKDNRLYVLTESGQNTLRCYNVPLHTQQAA